MRLSFNSNSVYVILATLGYECQYGMCQDLLRPPFLSVLSVRFLNRASNSAACVGWRLRIKGFSYIHKALSAWR